MNPVFPSGPVFFVAGATSPAGKLVVELAAVRGACVYMTGRNEDELQMLQNEMKRKGFRTAYAVADVAELDQLENAAEHCLTTFGKVTTWINLAGPEENDGRKIFESLFWSTVNGTRAAVPLLSREGGVVVNVNPSLEGLDPTTEGYTLAAIRAIKEFTRAMRREIHHHKGRITVRNFLPRESELPMDEAMRIVDLAFKKPRYWTQFVTSPGLASSGENFEGVERKRQQHWILRGILAGGAAILFLKKMRLNG